ncbi:glycerol acyltransferase [Spongiibacter sp. KMU-166]|uniref:Glycerol acyltransferase n=1 Tax=Spongiibacter thalassae TaxID=2721624 RepID=A0ABX1GMI5_9GAMM|nr:1-acyl-sn-glycerol-3-phosphate acyltransferase [Spongiibacter thalassae]NKI19359.1 glycerol acyltransferase [Spongiibacter thalassae]
MDTYSDIRPYHDDEVAEVLDRLLADRELLNAMGGLRLPRLHRYFPKLIRPLVSATLRYQMRNVRSIADFQAIVKGYMDTMIEGSTRDFSTGGTVRLQRDQAYLFISNHRDIALDPAFVNYALYHNDMDTVRIAIGDNLLSKPFAADLMRVNKSFIVRRSAKGPRQMLAAFKQLSSYIRFSLQQEKSSIWIAQREGRAKDGNDATEVALVKMICMSQDKSREDFGEFIAGLNIVPVSISYEWDPLDAAKAQELVMLESTGSYQKAEHEDLKSIATGILGDKGHVHVSFGDVLTGDFSSPAEVAAAIDEQVITNYRLHASNVLAYQRVHQDERWRELADLDISESDIQAFEQRFAAMPESYRLRAMSIYAQPILNKLALRDKQRLQEVS